jgi:class 3 adenylate cyclase/predicted ATPase
MKDIATWLAAVDLEKLLPLFEEQEIDLATVRELTEEDMRELGLPMGPRKKLTKAIEALNAAPPAANGDAEEKLDIATAAKGQSRQVTILFSDLSGFTNLSAEIGAEETHSLLQAFFEVADDIVRQHGGVVDKHIGDSVMAVFGVPVAYGNEAQRAMNAALAIQAAMPEISANVGRSVQVHIGLASGRVVADRVGSDEKFTVIGDSVNLAARLTDRAGAGQTIVSENVRSSLPLDVQIGEELTFSLKGFDRPVSAYLLAEQQELPQNTAQLTPIIGRSKEIAQFRFVLSECLGSGIGQFVYVRGEAGIGKTRLLKEFERLATQENVDCHRALVLDFGAAHRQDAIRALVRSLIGIRVNAEKNERLAAAEKLAGSGVLSDSERVHLNSILGLPQPEDLIALHDAMAADMRADGQRQIFFSLIEKAAALRPLLLIIEDIHWATAQTLSTIAETVRRIGDAKVIVLVTTRIEEDPMGQLHRQGLGATSLTTLDLRPLRPEEALALASAFPDPMSDLTRLCIERSAGNPLFLEQLLRNATATGFNAVPDTVQSLVQASLDSLGPRDREALEAAAIIGQRFHPDSVCKIIHANDYDFSELIVRRLIQLEGDLYLFSHALVRDGVYASILGSRRRELHAIAAEFLGQSDLSLRAQHLEQAQSPDAAKAYLDAANAAAEEQDEEFALELCAKGESLSGQDDILLELLFLKGRILLTLGRTRDSIDAFSQAKELSVSQDDQCRSLIGMAEGLRVANRNEEAIEKLELAEAMSASMPASERARIFHLRGSVLFTQGDREGCIASHNTSLELAKLAGDPASQAMALSGIGDASYLQGLMINARDRFDECVTLCKEHDLGRIEVANRHMVGWSRVHQLEFREALEDARTNAGLANRVANRRAEVLSLQLISYTSLKLGEYHEAEKAAKATVLLADQIDAVVFSITGLTILAQAQLALARPNDARDSISKALEKLKGTGRNFVGPYTLAVAASLATDPAMRRDYLQDGLAALEDGVIHNHTWFCDVISNIEFEDGHWPALLEHADRVEAAFRKQPQAHSAFIAGRARALARFGLGQFSPALQEEIRHLISVGEKVGLQPDTRILSQCLQKMSVG